MRWNALLRKFAGYLVTGGTAAVVDLGGFIVLDRLGMPIMPAAALSFLVAAGVNFLLSVHFVFRATARWSLFGMFLLMATVGFLLNVSITSLGVQVLSLDPALAKLNGIGIAFGFNFAMNALLVFGNDDPGMS